MMIAPFFKCFAPPFARGGRAEQGAARAQDSSQKPVSAWGKSAFNAFGLLLLLAILLGGGSARGQQERKRKIPVVDKLTTGSSHGAFSGNIASIDLEHHLLQVHPVKSENVEIFPVKKGIQVSSAGGEKLKLNQLKPGNNVIIYYEQRGDRRTVKEIVVLAAAPGEEKKKSPPSS
jgi:hypothetical protein